MKLNTLMTISGILYVVYGMGFVIVPAQGTVVFGLSPDGTIVGVEPGDLDRTQQSMSQTIKAKFEPRLQFTVQVLEVQGKRVLALYAQRHRDVPYHRVP